MTNKVENKTGEKTSITYYVGGSTLLTNFLASHDDVEEVKIKDKRKREYNIKGISRLRHISIDRNTIFLIDKGDVVDNIDTIPEETKINNPVKYSDTMISEKKLIAFIKGE